MHTGMASGLKRRFDDDDDDLSHFARCLKYRLVMTSMICVTLKMTGLTSMHHAPSFAALTSVVHLPTSKIIGLDTSNPQILYSQRAAWLLQASVFLVVLSLKIYIVDLSIKMLFGLMLKHKRPCSFSGLAQPGQK